MSTTLHKKALPGGGTVLFARRPLLGHVYVTGSIIGGTQLGRMHIGSEKGDTLASMHAALLLEGTEKHTKEELQVLLDSMGATLSFSSTADRLVFSGRVGSDNLNTFLALIVEVLTSATFPEHELAILRTHIATQCALEMQETRTQATIHLTRALYPEGHPLYDDLTEDTLAASRTITRAEIAHYHTCAIDRSTLVISIVGDVAADVPLVVEKYFKRLPHHAIVLAPIASASTHHPAFVTTPIADKASIDYLVGITTGITDVHPDYPALMIGINILAQWGGFAGRLMKIVREKEGLTYGAYGRLVGMNLADGYISIWSTFAPELFHRGRTSVRREIVRIAENGVELNEFRKHRDMYIAHSRISTLEASALVATLHELTVRGKPLSYLRTFPERIAQVKKREVEMALKTYLIFEECTESAAGPVESV